MIYFYQARAELVELGLPENPLTYKWLSEKPSKPRKTSSPPHQQENIYTQVYKDYELINE